MPQKILTIGSASLDIFIGSEHFKTLKTNNSPSGLAECFSLGSKIEIDNATISVGGGAVNTAVTFQRMGLSTAVLSNVGNDIFAEEIFSVLQKEKIETAHIGRDKKHRTSFAIIIHHPGFDRTILVYRNASKYISWNSNIYSKIKPNWIYLTSIGGNQKILAKIINDAHAQNIKIAFNPGQTELKIPANKLHPLLKKVDVLLLNATEAAQLTNIKNAAPKQLISSLTKMTPNLIAITDGKKGAWVYGDDKKIYYSKATSNKTVNATGAGDAFGSALVSGLILTKNINKALKLAMINSGQVVLHLGATKGILKAFPEKKL